VIQAYEKSYKKYTISILILLPVVVVSLTATVFGLWGLFFWDSHEISYADLRLITHNVDCLIRDPSFNSKSISCDPWNRQINYPWIWVEIFKVFNLGSEKTNLVGIFLNIVFIVTNFILLIRFNVMDIKYIFYLTILFLTPPVFMLMERGNIDIVIYLIVAGVSLLAASVTSMKIKSISVLIAIAGYLKLFPFALISIYFSLSKAMKKLSEKIFFLLIIAFSVILISPELKNLYNFSPDYPSMQYGVRNLVLQVSYCIPNNILIGYCENNKPMEFLIGFIIFTFVATIFWVIQKYFGKNLESEELIRMINKEISAKITFLIFGICFTSSFLMGSSWYYRLVFLIPVVITFSSLIKNNLKDIITAGIIVTFITFSSSEIFFRILASFLSTCLFIAISMIVLKIFWLDIKAKSVN